MIQGDHLILPMVLDSESAFENAIQYVIQKPMKDNKKRQVWSFVTPFSGITRNARVTYH